MKLILPVAPTANSYYRSVNGRVLLSKAGRAYDKAVAIICLFQRVRKVMGEVSITITWYRATKTGDVDNRLKGLLDSLKHRAFEDDKMVRRLTIERHDDKDNPRMEVEIVLYERRSSNG